MLTNQEINKLLASMSDDNNKNIQKIKQAFGNINYKNSNNESLLHIFVDKKYNEDLCFKLIKSLLSIGLSPNLQDCFKYNFIQTALYTGYSEDFIINIIKESLKYNLDINHVDSDSDTIMHTAIYSDNYLGEIINIYTLLCDNNFNTKAICGEGRTLIQAINYMAYYNNPPKKNYTSEKIEQFKSEIHKRSNIISEKTEQKIIVKEKNIDTSLAISSNINLDNSEIKELEKWGTILNKQKFITEPTIGRNQEIMELIIKLAKISKSVIITGEANVGKTALVKELVYLIKTKQVPDFLTNKIILSINPSHIVSGKHYVGEFEEAMEKLFKICDKYSNKLILFIDDIQGIYGVGASASKDNDMSNMLKRYLENSPLKIIGTTNNYDYEKYFSNNSLKKHFETIKIKEPSSENLLKIIDKTLDDYQILTGISFECQEFKKEICQIIKEATDRKNRVYNDIINNPELSISIIEQSYAIARVFNKNTLTLDNLIESFKLNERINSIAKNRAISKLKLLAKNPPIKKKAKIIDFNSYRK